MENNANRSAILVLDEAELNLVGGRVVGGNFETAVYLSAAAVAILGPCLGFTYWVMNPTNRRDCWSIFMSNFRRSTVAAVTTAASVASTTPVSARDDLTSVDNVLDSSLSDLDAFQSALQILDDPNEV
jgi:hypothetical protein